MDLYGNKNFPGKQVERETIATFEQSRTLLHHPQSAIMCDINGDEQLVL